MSDTLALCLKTSPSSRGLGHRPFTAVTRVRTPLGALGKEVCENLFLQAFLYESTSKNVCCHASGDEQTKSSEMCGKAQ